MSLLDLQPTETATRKTPVCDHLKIPGIDADFCPFCRIYYPVEVLDYAKAHPRLEPPKSPHSTDVPVGAPSTPGLTAKIITLWQPWATLIAVGLKAYETRSWGTSYRGQLLIHAAKRPMEPEDIGVWYRAIALAKNAGLAVPDSRIAEEMPYGAVVAVVKLDGCIEMKTPFIERQTELEESVGLWAEGRYAWRLTDIKPVESIPWKGGQGLRDASSELLSLIRFQSKQESPPPPVEESVAPPPEPHLETLPDPPSQEITNPSWQMAKAQTYLKLMNQIAGSSLTPEAKRAEIARLQRLRDEALAKAKTEELTHA